MLTGIIIGFIGATVIWGKVADAIAWVKALFIKKPTTPTV